MVSASRWLAVVGVAAVAWPHAGRAGEPSEAEPTDGTAARPSAMDHLARAQTRRADGDLEEALAEADAATRVDDGLAFAYLMRAQILIELANVDEDSAADVERLREAASDLDRYIELAQLDEAARRRLQQRRDDVLAQAEHIESELQPEPPPRPPPPRPAPELEVPMVEPTIGWPRLMKTQRMANSAAALIAVVPALLGTGIAALARRDADERIAIGPGGVRARL